MANGQVQKSCFGKGMATMDRDYLSLRVWVMPSGKQLKPTEMQAETEENRESIVEEIGIKRKLRF